MTTTRTPAIGAADMPEALRRSTAADGKTELFNLPGYPLMVRAVDFNRIHTESEMRRAALLDEMQKAALAAGQATAAQAVVPAEWPTNEMIDAGRKAAASQGRLLGSGQSLWHVFRAMLAAAPAQPAAQQGAAYAALPVPNYPKSGGFPGTFAEAQMRAFADATHTLRASHGQAPAVAPAGETPWRSAVLNLIDECPGLTMEQDRWLSRRVKELEFASAPRPTAQAAGSVPAPPPECETEAEKRAFAFGWFKALESERMNADNKKKDPL